MKVFIGVSGSIGGLLARNLIDRGDEVSGLVRRDEQRADLAIRGIDARVAELADITPDSLASMLSGVDAVVYTAGSNGGTRENTAAIDGDGVVKALEATRLACVRRFTLVSVLPESGRDQELDEDTEFSWTGRRGLRPRRCSSAPPRRRSWSRPVARGRHRSPTWTARPRRRGMRSISASVAMDDVLGRSERPHGRGQTWEIGHRNQANGREHRYADRECGEGSQPVTSAAYPDSDRAPGNHAGDRDRQADSAELCLLCATDGYEVHDVRSRRGDGRLECACDHGVRGGGDDELARLEEQGSECLARANHRFGVGPRLSADDSEGPVRAGIEDLSDVGSSGRWSDDRDRDVVWGGRDTGPGTGRSKRPRRASAR